jgi:hypothetical protein
MPRRRRQIAAATADRGVSGLIVVEKFVLQRSGDGGMVS